jgi:hypothetical protein
MDVTLGPVTLIVGANEAGKTSIIEALEWALTGSITGSGGRAIERGPEGAWSLASAASMAVRVRGTGSDGPWMLRRMIESEIDREGRRHLRSSLMTTWEPHARGVRIQEAAIAEHLWTRPEVWDLAPLVNESPAKLRGRLLSALGVDTRMAVVPPDLRPAWAPVERKDDAVSWLARATRECQVRLSTAHQDLVAAQVRLRDAEAGWSDHENREPTVAQIDLLTSRLGAREALDVARREVERLDAARHERAAEAERLRPLVATLAARGYAARVARTVRDAALRSAGATARVADDKRELADLDREIEQARAWRLAHTAIASERELLAEIDRIRGAIRAGEEIEDARTRTANRLTDCEIRLEAITGAKPTSCPRCGFADSSALESWQTRRDTLAAERDAIAGLLDSIAEPPPAGDLGAAQARLRLAREEAIERKRLDGLVPILERKRAAAAAIVADAAGGAPLLDLATAEQAVRKAEQAVREAERADDELDRCERALEDIQRDLRAARSRVEELERLVPANDAGVVAERDRLREELSGLDERNRVRDAYREAQREVSAASAAIDGLKAVSNRLAGLESRIVGDHVGPVLDRMSASLGRTVTLRLEDDSGAPDASFFVGGVPLATISDGTWLRASAAFRVALLHADGRVLWRPLILDRVESISIDRRSEWLRSIVEMQRSGEIDQAIILGCPDIPPEVEGVTVLRRGGAR